MHTQSIGGLGMKINYKVRVIIISIIVIAAALFSDLNARNRRRFDGVLPPDKAQKMLLEEKTEEEVVEEEYYSPVFLLINIPSRSVTLFEDGNEVARYSIAVGQPVFKTPAGPQSIKTIVWNPWWIPPDSPWAAGEKPQRPGPRNALGPVKLLMAQGIRMHGTNKDRSVGRYASHGCLRMHNKEAAELAWRIQKKINNSDNSLFDKYSKNRYRSFWVQLQYPVDAEIIYEPVEVRDDIIHIYSDTYRWGSDVQTEVMEALVRHGIDLTTIDAVKLDQLRYPKKRYEIMKVNLSDLLIGAPERIASINTEEE